MPTVEKSHHYHPYQHSDRFTHYRPIASSIRNGLIALQEAREIWVSNRYAKASRMDNDLYHPIIRPLFNEEREITLPYDLFPLIWALGQLDWFKNDFRDGVQ